MLDEAAIRRLLAQKSEFRNIDFKLGMNWSIASKDEKTQLVKDILAMMNTQDGGHIILGVEDGTCEPIGLSSEEAASFDPTRLNDFLHKYTDPQTSIEVQKLQIDGKTLVVLSVPEFKEVPVICKADGSGLQRGRIYIRTDKASSEAVSTVEEMRDLITRGMLKRGDQLLSNIRGLLVGDTGLPTTSDPQQLYASEIQDAISFIERVLPTEEMEKGYFELRAMPTTYVQERVPDLRELSEALAGAEVSLRGWNFPHMDRDHMANFQKGRQSHTIWAERQIRHIEAFRLYRSGLFIWRGAYLEEAPAYKREPPAMSWSNLIMDVTESLLFLSRLYSRIAEDASVSISIKLTNTMDRQLVSYGFQEGELHGMYISKEPEIAITRTFPVSQLRTSFESDANSIARRIFESFQWMNPDLPSLIAEKQRRLIERKW